MFFVLEVNFSDLDLTGRTLSSLLVCKMAPDSEESIRSPELSRNVP